MKTSTTRVQVTCDGCGAGAEDSRARRWQSVTVTISTVAGEQVRTRSVDLCDRCSRLVVVPGIANEAAA